MGFARSDDEIAQRLSEYLKARVAEAGLTYADLAQRMKKHGRPKETAATIKQKLFRGTFSATFLVAAVAALGLGGIDLDDI